MSVPSEPSSLAAIKTPISQEALDQMFRKARTHSSLGIPAGNRDGAGRFLIIQTEQREG